MKHTCLGMPRHLSGYIKLGRERIWFSASLLLCLLKAFMLMPLLIHGQDIVVLIHPICRMISIFCMFHTSMLFPTINFSLHIQISADTPPSPQRLSITEGEKHLLYVSIAFSLLLHSTMSHLYDDPFYFFFSWGQIKGNPHACCLCSKETFWTIRCFTTGSPLHRFPLLSLLTKHIYTY